MQSTGRLTPRERLIRLIGGLALTAAGCGIFAYSKAHDPGNHAAILGILAIVFGSSWVLHGIRGRRDSVTHHEEQHVPPGPLISPERTLFGILGAWIVPGLGHFLIGRRGKAILYFVTITVTFLIGTVLAQGRNLSFDRDPVYFGAYLFNAGETGLGWLLTRHLEMDRNIRLHQLGLTYTAVACLLNVVAMMDFLATCGRAADAVAAEEGANAGSSEGNA